MMLFEYLAGWLQARFGVSDRGAGLVEYVLLLSLIALVCLAAVSYLGGNNGGSLNRSSDSIVNAG